MTAVLLAAALMLGSAGPPYHGAPPPRQESAAMRPAGWCGQFRITGYVRTEFSARTADGTPIWTDEPIVAASWDIPLGHYVDIDGLGLHRVADRGMLGSAGWLDVAVWDRATAYRLTGYRMACVYAPEDVP